MQLLKKIILSTTSALTISTCFFMSSCAPKNSCDTLVCQNGGTCASDFCSCPTGYDGPECQNKITDRYIGTYAGWTRPNVSTGQGTHIDTVDVYNTNDPLMLAVVRRRRPDMIYTGIVDTKTNTIVVSDLVDGNKTSVVNVTLKAPTSVDTKRALNLNVVDYENNNKTNELDFSGYDIK